MSNLKDIQPTNEAESNHTNMTFARFPTSVKESPYSKHTSLNDITLVFLFLIKQLSVVWPR